MDELRITLIFIGIVLLGAIYWLGRRDERRAQQKKAAQQTVHSPFDNYVDSISEKSVQDAFKESEDYDSYFLPETDKDERMFFKPTMKNQFVAQSAGGYPSHAANEQAMQVSAPDPVPQTIELPAGVEPLLIHLTVMAPRDMTFDPHYLKQTLDDCGLSHGDMQIYHYYRRPRADLEPNRGQRLFSIASMIEPGYFDPQEISTYRTPGLALFLQLPGPIDGVLAFEKMHQMGEMLAKRLSGILCDDKRNKITPQAITHIKDQIVEYNLKLRTRLLRTVH